MERLNQFDRITLLSLGLIGLLIGLVVARGDTVGAQIQSTLPENGGFVSANGRIGITFKQAMQVDSFHNQLEIQPDLPGRVQWEGNTLWFIPNQAFAPDTNYSLHLKAGELSKDGRRVKKDVYLSFHTRLVQVLYLSTRDQKPDIYRQPLNGSPVQVTFTGGNVYDYAPSPDGEQIAYSVNNTQGGIDLWLIQRDGSLNRQLASCGLDHCIQAAWSPDGKQMVYNRKVAALNSSISSTPSGLYSVDLRTDQSSFLFPGEDPSFSPDGQWLVTSDTQGNGIGVFNINTGDQVQIPASVDQTPTWYPDASKMLYADLQIGAGIPQERLYVIDFKNKKVSQILNDDVDQVEYNLPSISPDGHWMVVSLHLMAGGQTKQLWFMDVNGKNRKAITHDELLTNSYYSWDPWGNQVLFQQFPYGISDAQPQVVVWDRQTGLTHLLAQAAALPRWIP